MFFFPGSNIKCFTCCIHLWPIYWFSLVDRYVIARKLKLVFSTYSRNQNLLYRRCRTHSLLFHKVGHSNHDLLSEMFEAKFNFFVLPSTNSLFRARCSLWYRKRKVFALQILLFQCLTSRLPAIDSCALCNMFPCLLASVERTAVMMVSLSNSLAFYVVMWTDFPVTCFRQRHSSAVKVYSTFCI
jgi:hypothetical protein